MTASLDNTGVLEAFDVQVSVEGLDTDKIYMEKNFDMNYIKSIPAGYSQKMSFAFAASSKVKKGTYPVTLKVKYRDSKNTLFQNDFMYYVNVSDTKAIVGTRANVQLTNIVSPQDTFNVGNEFTFFIDLVNTGGNKATNVKITATTDSEESLISKTANVIMVNELEAEAHKRIFYTFAATSKAKTGNYAVKFTVEYENGELGDDDKPKLQTFLQYGAVNIVNTELDKKPDEKDKVSMPKIIISSYKSTPTVVKANANFDLFIEFQNTHKEKSINNIKVTITPMDSTDKKGNVFTPVNGSNTIFISDLAPLQKTSKDLTMFTIPDAEARSYMLSVKFKYQDEQFNVYEEEEIIGINVKQVVKLETSKITIQEEAPLNSNININFSLINSGKVNLGNVKVAIEGDFNSANANIYVGNLAKGASKYYDGAIRMTKEGQIEGNIIVSGEDDSGEVLTIEQPFSVNVTAMRMPEMDMSMPPMDVKKPQASWKDIAFWKNLFMQYKIYIGIGVAVVVVLIVVLLRKRKKDMNFNE